jgi:hypothetical protein
MIKTIFNKTILFKTDIPEINETLQDELRFYESESQKKIDVTVEITNTIDMEAILVNPSVHITCDQGFGIKTGVYTIYWIKTEISLYCIIHISPHTSFLSREFSRLRNMEYRSFASIGQILHEFVFVPLCYFFHDIAPILCSSILSGDQAILFGGTGGTGKTSTLLEIGKNNRIHFLSDDILVVDRDQVYPNYAFPKIYAYNTEGDREMERELLKKSSLGNKLHWHIKKKLRPSGVRRRMDPAALYSIKKCENIQVKEYIIFNRGKFDTVSLEKIDHRRAAALTLLIMKPEYSIYHNHIYWDAYNRLLMNEKPLLNLDSIFQNWHSIYMKQCKGKNLYMCNIPLDISHQNFKHKVMRIIEKLL